MSRIALALFAAALLATACGGPDHGAPSSAAGALEVTPDDDGAPADDATCTTTDAACCQACGLVHGCRPDVTVASCEDRCLASNWVWPNNMHCLAARVLWIDEDGCPRIGPTWDGFDDGDLCLD